jgi:hypothetical protein
VLACTLLPYDERFELGRTLAEAGRRCHSTIRTAPSSAVLGGAACCQWTPAARRRRHPNPERQRRALPHHHGTEGDDHEFQLSMTVCDGGSRDDTVSFAYRAGAHGS